MMQDPKLWVDLAGVIIEVGLLAYFMHALLGPMRCKGLCSIGAYLALGGCYWAISYGMALTYARTISYLLVNVLFAALFYQGRVWTKAFAGFSFMLMSALLDYFVHAFMMVAAGEIYVTGGHDLENYILGLALSKGLIIILTQGLIEYLRHSQHQPGQLTLGNLMLLLFNPLVNMLAFFMLYRATLQSETLYSAYQLLVVALLLLASSISVFVVFNKIRTANQLEQEHVRAKQQLASQQQFYSAQAEKHRSLRAWNHEFKNTLVVLAGFIRSGEPEQALDYIAQTEVKLSQSLTPLTGNIALDAVLDNKLQIAKELQVELKYTISTFEPLRIDVMDLVVVLANGLDNALEATAKLADPAGQMITCSVIVQQNWLKIIIVNPVAQRVNLSGTTLPTDKDDTLRHGIGLTNVEHIAKRYQGKLKVKCDDKQFTFTVIMANEEPVTAEIDHLQPFCGT